MSDSTTPATLSAEAVQALARLKSEPDWMVKRRHRAWQLFEDIPMPTTREEFWKYTDLSTLSLDEIAPLPATTAKPVTTLENLPPTLRRVAKSEEPKAGVLAQHNSEVVYASLGEEWSRNGVIFTGMETALREHGDLLRKYLMEPAVYPGHNKFTALNGALRSGGAFLYVPKNVRIDIPLATYSLLDVEGAGLFQHTVVILETGAEATFFEHGFSEDFNTPTLVSGVVEIYLNDAASLKYVSIMEWGRNVYELSTKRALAGQDVSMDWIFGMLGSSLTKLFADTLLQKPGGSTTTRGFYVALDGQHLDFTPLMKHSAHHTTGDLLYKGVLKGKSRSVFRGLIQIDPQAMQADSYLVNNNILLSREAHADSIPTLEIKANDVRATHGSTTGPIDEDQIFYLMSRGLTPAVAQQLIVDGFFAAVLDAIPSDEVRERAWSAIRAKLAT